MTLLMAIVLVVLAALWLWAGVVWVLGEVLQAVAERRRARRFQRDR